ncbi:MAG TPA: SDR family NAD(P)-dependent oxidoreductase [Candidatus Paceibacterota bacterium]|nr:SDR family NAD(P)-dependent oxidoreductase [Candidatus Paceibacterota bacterium]
MEIRGKVAIVTGASSGIGLALAKRLAEGGATVVLAARSVEKLQKIQKELPRSLAVPVDLSNFTDIRYLVERTKEYFGRIDILINNAGQGMRASVEEIDLHDYRAIMELNVFAPLQLMQEVIPIMRAQGGGMILNVSSMVSKNFYPRLAAYASTKYALNALSLTAHEELKDDRIVVSVFYPKMTATEFGMNALGEKYSSAAGRQGMTVDTPEDVAAHIVEQIESEAPEANM